MSFGEILKYEMCRNFEVTDEPERLLETALGVCMKYQFLMPTSGTVNKYVSSN
jgi:hypothetical protein